MECKITTYSCTYFIIIRASVCTLVSLIRVPPTSSTSSPLGYSSYMGMWDILLGYLWYGDPFNVVKVSLYFIAHFGLFFDFCGLFTFLWIFHVFWVLLFLTISLLSHKIQLWVIWGNYGIILGPNKWFTPRKILNLNYNFLGKTWVTWGLRGCPSGVRVLHIF